ncbi:MAG TPA: metallophosphoesterase [Gemmatimonadaceae bacterium]|nr:metallophosphoesterase [Gemmatimonadaceae bacterium]
MDRRTFLRRGAAALGAGMLGSGAYAWGIEPRWVEVVQRDMPIVALPAHWQGRRLVQLSDIHVGPGVGDGYLTGALREVATLQPDLLVITGDLVTFGDPGATPRLRALLRQLPHGRVGTVAVLGNHDYGRGWKRGSSAMEVTRVLRDAGVDVLRNDVRDVDGLLITGLDDLWSGRMDVTRAIGPVRGAPAVALCHNPDGADAPGWDGFTGWILAGHTHGGQCRPPFLPAPLLPVRNRRYAAGEVPLADGRRLYVNRGLGHVLPVRFNVRPEITSFTLRRAGHA